MKYKICFTIFSMLFSLIAFAQASYDLDAETTIIASTDPRIPFATGVQNMTLHGKDWSKPKIKGSRFLNNEFKTGQFRLNDSLAFNSDANYDMYKDLIVIKNQKNQEIELLKNSTIKYFKIGDDEFVYLKKGLKDGYYKINARGTNHFIVSKHSKTIIPPKPGNAYSKPTSAKFSNPKASYFVYELKSKRFYELGTKKSQIVSALKEQFGLSKKEIRKLKTEATSEFDLDNKNFANLLLRKISKN